MATAEEGRIKEAEFAIEKQKKNTLDQEKKLFFKAPAKTTKNYSAQK